jgi:hypothetical protein
VAGLARQHAPGWQPTLWLARAHEGPNSRSPAPPSSPPRRRAMHAQLLALRSLVRLLDPPLYAHLEAHDCLSFFFCYRWLLILFKRELPFEEVRVLVWGGGGGGAPGTRPGPPAPRPGPRAGAAPPPPPPAPWLAAGAARGTALAPPAKGCKRFPLCACAAHGCKQAALPVPFPVLRRCCACGRRCGRASRACTSTCALRCWSTTDDTSSGMQPAYGGGQAVFGAWQKALVSPFAGPCPDPAPLAM